MEHQVDIGEVERLRGRLLGVEAHGGELSHANGSPRRWGGPTGQGKQGRSRRDQGGESFQDPAEIHVAGEAIALSLYPRLMSILTATDDLDPDLRSIGWVMRLMDELYDAKRKAKQASFAAEEDHFNLDAGMRKHASFPAFAYKHLKNRHGIKYMVRSVCLDLVCNVHIYRKQHSEVEVFARFLEEFYGPKELCFFLDVRAEAHRVARIGNGQRSATRPVWMSFPDCVRVAKGMFLDTATLYFRDLITTVEGQMASHCPDGGPPNLDRRRISLSDFLYLAMVCFVSPKDPEDRPCQEEFAGSSRLPVHRVDGTGDGGGSGEGDGGVRSSNGVRTTNGVGSPSVPMTLPIASGDRRFFRLSPGDERGGGSPAKEPQGERGNSHTCLRFRESIRDVDDGSSTWRHAGCRIRGEGDRGSRGECRARGYARESEAKKQRDTLEETIAHGAASGSGRHRGSKAATHPRRYGSPGKDERCYVEGRGPRTPWMREDAWAPSLLLGRTIAGGPPASVKMATQDHSPKAYAQRLSPPLRTGPEDSSQSRPFLSADEHTTRPCGTRSASAGTAERYAERFAEQLAEDDGTEQYPRLVGPPSPLSTPCSHEGRPFGREKSPFLGLDQSEHAATARKGFGSPNRRTERVDGALLLTGRDILEQRGERQRGIGRGLLNAQDAWSAFSPASTDRAADNGRPVEDEQDEEGNEIKNRMGSSGGGESLCGPSEQMTGGDRVSFAPDWRSTEDTTASFASADDGSGEDPHGRSAPGNFGATRAGEEEAQEQNVREGDTLLLLPQSPRLQGRNDVVAPPLLSVTTRSLSGTAIEPSATAGSLNGENPLSSRKTDDEQRPPQTLNRSFVWNEGKECHGSGEGESVVSVGAHGSLWAGSLTAGNEVKDDSSDGSNGLEIRTDVLSTANEWLASFERRFMPQIVRDCSRGRLGTIDGSLPPPIARVLSEEMVRVLALRRRDLHAVARHSPDLLHDAVTQAFRELESALSTASAHSRALCNMGRLLDDRDSPNEALLCFEEASAADTTSAEALCWRAGNLERKEDLSGAVFYFEGALARDESYWSAWYGLGRVKAAQGRYADAVEALTRWFEGENGGPIGGVSGSGREGRARTSQAKGLVQLGDAHRALGQNDQAQASYERAISMDEGFSDAHFKLGSLLQARGGHDARALEAFGRAVKAAAGAPATPPQGAAQEGSAFVRDRDGDEATAAFCFLP